MSGEPRRSSRVQANKEALDAAKEIFMTQERLRAAESLDKLRSGPAKELLTVKPKYAAKYEENLVKQNANWEKFMTNRRVQSSSIDAIAELFTIKATDLALLNFGPTHVALWETNYPGDGIRGIFELGDVDEQCEQTIGPVVVGTTLCWICGMPIWGTAKELLCEDQNGHSPECEHILPVAQAAVFLQLYDKSNAESDLFKYEYDWSHKTCNQTKNADVYFKVKEADQKRGVSLDKAGLPVFNEAAVLTLLERIYDSTRSDATCEPRPKHVRQDKFFIDKLSFKDTLQDWIHFKYNKNPRSVEMWKESRVKVFRAKYDAILHFIGGTNYKFNPQTYILALASAVAEIVNRQDENRKPGAGKQSVRRLTLGYQPAPTVISDTLKATLTADNAAIAAAQDPTPPPEIIDPPPEVPAEETELSGFTPPADPPPTSDDYIAPFPPPYDQLISPSPNDIHFTFDMMSEEKFYEDDILQGVVGLDIIKNSPNDQSLPNDAAAPAAPVDGASAAAAVGLLSMGAVSDSQQRELGDSQGLSGGRRRHRTRRRTASFLPYYRRRTYHAMRMSSMRKAA
jgi:hypothetical protein